jgi:3-methylfumaryl-CoA hydratase
MDLTDHNEHRVVRQETCSLATVRRVAAMLDQDPDKWADGDALPRGWQFILLGADTRRSALREDGFPGLGVPLADFGLPRLVLGGRSVRYDGDIRIGTTLRRESFIQKLAHKNTPNGPIAIVTLAHSLHDAVSQLPVLTETQTYILMSARRATRVDTDPAPLDPPATIKRITPDETLLFQYSALGFNSHRIHLDRDFAREQEGFPDLVVNGGLVTLLMTELLRTELGGHVSAITSKHVAPLFCGRPIMLAAEQQDGRWQLRAFDNEGRLAVDIQAEVDGKP